MRHGIPNLNLNLIGCTVCFCFCFLRFFFFLTNLINLSTQFLTFQPVLLDNLFPLSLASPYIMPTSLAHDSTGMPRQLVSWRDTQRRVMTSMNRIHQEYMTPGDFLHPTQLQFCKIYFKIFMIFSFTTSHKIPMIQVPCRCSHCEMRTTVTQRLVLTDEGASLPFHPVL